MNYKLLLQYDGTEFHGWQIQGELRTVQGELTQALSLIDGRSVNVHGSGRTDAGVHAEGQVASVILQREISCDKLRGAINGNVGKDVRVLDAEAVAEEAENTDVPSGRDPRAWCACGVCPASRLKFLMSIGRS